MDSILFNNDGSYMLGGDDMLAALIVRIEEKRRELYNADPEDRIIVSQELDILITQYHKLKLSL